MKTKKISIITLALFFLTACGPKEKEYRIALAAPLTGDYAAMGQGMKRASEIAVEEANLSGKFKCPIKLRLFDDRGDPKEAVNVANQIVSDSQIVAVIGHLNSGCSIPASQVYAKKNLLMITAATTNPKLTLQQMEPSWKWLRNIFRVCTTDDVQGQFVANYLREKTKARSASIIHDKTPYGQGLAEEFRKEFISKGGQVLSFDGISTGDRDFKALLTRVKTGNPEILYFGGIYTEAGLIVKQARELGLKSSFVSGDGVQSTEFFKLAGTSAEGSYITNVGYPPEKIPSAKSFIEKYAKKYSKTDMQPYDSYTYEAVLIALTALEKAGIQTNSEKIDRIKMIDFMKTLTYDGVTGHTEFDDKGDTKNRSITVYIVRDGKFLLVN